METILFYWAIFGIIVITLLVLDLGVFNKRDTVMSLGQSLSLSLFYITIACCFGGYIHYALGTAPAHDYFTGFLLEKAMSLDNIFVISMIFSFFKMGLSIQLCKFIHKPLNIVMNSIFKFYQKMSHSFTPILNRHSPFYSDIINCQV